MLSWLSIAIDTITRKYNDRSLSWIGTDASIKSGRVKLVLCYKPNFGKYLMTAFHYVDIIILTLLHTTCTQTLHTNWEQP